MNENKNAPLPCHVVRDLLPLYHDGVVSAETRSAVGDHLMECESCRAEYQAMARPLPEQAGKSGSTLDRFRALMRRQKRKKILAIVLAAVLAACAVSGGVAALSQWYIVPVSGDAPMADRQPPEAGYRATAIPSTSRWNIPCWTG